MAKKLTYEELEQRVRQLEHEVSKRRLVEKELSIFQRLAEAAGYGFGIADADGNITYANHALCRILGEGTPEDAYGNNVAMYYPEPAKEELLNRILPTVFNDGQWVGSLTLLSIEGKETPTIQNIFVVRAKGEANPCIANLIIDISDRQRIDDALRGSKATLESIFRAAPIGIGLVSNRVLKRVNDRISEMTGYSREELVEQSARILYPSEEEFEYVGTEKYAQIREQGTGTLETHWQRKDGEVIDVLLSSTPLDPNDLSAGVTFTALDITERTRAEEALRESEEAARHVSIELALGLSEVFEGLKEISSGNPSVRISEVSNLELIAKLKQMVNQAARDLGEIVNLSHEFAMGLAEHFDVLHRVSKGDLAVRASGVSQVELLESLKKVTNEMIESVARAMAEQERAEEALRESEERYRRLTENSQVGIWQINGKGFTIYLNPAMCAMLEIEKPQELDGKTYHSSFTPESLETIKNESANRLEGLGFSYEVTIVGKHKGKRNVVVSGAPLLSHDGKLQSIIATFTDITQRKRAEKALRKAYEELEQKVEKRTADLTKTNELLLVDRKKLRSLAAQLSLAEEKERRRIATEVHDQIGQNLAFAKMKLGELRTSTSPQARSDTVGEIIELIDGTIQDTRSMVSELGSPILYELGLVPAVEWLTQQAESKHNFKAEFKDDGNPKPVSDEVQVFLFQAVRELLANVAKHAKATSCTVSLKTKEDNIRVDVVDDGIGFDEKAVGRNPEKGTGFGFFSIRERLEPLGGSLGIYSKPGEGARLTLIAPLSQPL